MKDDSSLFRSKRFYSCIISDERDDCLSVFCTVLPPYYNAVAVMNPDTYHAVAFCP